MSPAEEWIEIGEGGHFNIEVFSEARLRTLHERLLMAGQSSGPFSFSSLRV